MSVTPHSDAFLIERPFGRASQILLHGWWAAAGSFTTEPADVWLTSEFASRVTAPFSALGRVATQTDPHLTDGIYESVRSLANTKIGRGKVRRKVSFTRPYLLLLNQFRNPQVLASLNAIFDGASLDKRNRAKQYLFSPLYFIRQMLTAPDYPASEAYAHVIVRAEIYATALLFAQKTARTRSEIEDLDSVAAIRNFISFDEVAASLQKFTSYARNKDTFYAATPTDFIVGHMLASRGLALFSFAPGSGQYKPERRNEKSLVGRDVFLAGRDLVPTSGIYEFRVLDDVERLPSPAELVNELDGIPLALPGADIVFAKGIRSTTDRGVVGRISGSSGAGKTTVALSIATALAPIGVTTLYLSCEEDAVDLRKRVFTLTPPFIARTATFPREIDDWFQAEHLALEAPKDNRATAQYIIEDLVSAYRDAGIRPSEDAPPGVLPLLVVFDGIHELIQRNTDEDQVVAIRNLVEKFRELGAFVLILTAQTEDPALRELDFVVDFVVRLEHVSPSDQSDEPLRKFVLHKTRLQYSRPGAHVLHISKRDGVKIYPRLAAQLDSYSHLKWKNQDRSTTYDFLQTGLYAREDTRPLVKIHHRSQVLLSGRGSAGKAGFALKLLMKPLISKQSGENTLFSGRISSDNKIFKDPRRVLVVSFLYNEEYYRELITSVSRNLSVDSATKQSPPAIELDVITLYPGFLAPEVLMAKVLGIFERRVLDGSSFSGVIIDGLHNVFLQFPRLQDSLMIWPILFEVFRILGVTVITTHTQFEVRGMDAGIQFRADIETAIQRVGPLLQALVNAADFYFDISLSPSSKNDRPLYAIDTVTALGQDVRAGTYFWDRENSVVQIRPL